tara:strand:- start:1545 stop:1865 length:321 start_codon:yes stop_codon:yes gene_type:complete
MMKTEEIYAHLRTMTREELIELNNAVVHEVKWKRKQDTADKKRTLKVGMRVWYDGKHGYTEGTITELRRTKASVVTDDGQGWNCPITILNQLVEKKTFNPATGEFE